MDGRVFLATTPNGVARASGSNDLWSVETVLNDLETLCLAADPLQPGRVYAGTRESGVYRSDDSGRNWKAAGLDGEVVKSLAASPAKKDLVFAGTRPPRLYVSHDAGRNWEEIEAFSRIKAHRLWLSPADPPGIVGYVQALAPSPDDADVLLAGVEVGGVWRTADGGSTWSRGRGAIIDCHSLAFHFTAGNFAYQGGAGFKGAAALSDDAGANWTPEKSGPQFRYGWSVAADPEQPETVYVSAASGPRAHSGDAPAHIFRRSGDGEWVRLAGGLPDPLYSMPYALITEPDGPGSLFAGMGNGDIWHTVDYGETWAQVPVNLGAIDRSLVLL